MTPTLSAGAAVKSLLYGAARATGLGALVRNSAWRSARLAILCYHGVSLQDEHLALPELYVSAQTLRRRLEQIRRRDCTVLPLGVALDRLSEGRLPPRSVALTFDDGTRDFADLALPLLEEFGMPATVYVTTYYSERGWPVFNTAGRYLLWRGRRHVLPLADLLGGEHRDAPVRLDTAAARQAAWRVIEEHARARDLSGQDKQDLLVRMAERVGVDVEAFLADGQFCIMAPDRIASLPWPLIDVQLHTHRHRTPRDKSSFLREIGDNRASLEPMLGGRPTTHFCYPSGDYAGAFLPWLRQLGIRSATTCVPGLAGHASDPLLLPRIIDTSLTSDLSFEAWLDGTASLLPRRREWRLDPARD